MSGFGKNAKSAETLEISRSSRGQFSPQDCPPPPDVATTPLGDALNISEVARLLGCSVWTVRQRYVPQGLPHIRASASGRLVFFRNQVIRWVVARQQKGAGK